MMAQGMISFGMNRLSITVTIVTASPMNLTSTNFKDQDTTAVHEASRPERRGIITGLFEQPTEYRNRSDGC
jgi:hypothetical protein